MADLCFHQIHLAHAALILLERSDALRIGRPEQDGAIAPGPARIVGGVAEVLDAVAGELNFAIGVGGADPEVVVAENRDLFSIGGAGFYAPPAAPAPATSAGSGRRGARFGNAPGP